ncbi:MAG: DUF2723 domain-containing protein, partial [Candidatus Goldbacteria bacterium]|nr:DUF2723 domain-containing protein [Candidatus Goldiibacteriota bacterium]
EIASAAYNLSIGHPPGYPIFLLFGKIATFLPLGDIAFRINFLSVILSAVVFLLLYISIKKFLIIIDKKNIFFEYISIALSLIFIFSNDFLSIATNIKGGIYVFNIIVVLVCIYSTICYYVDDDIRFFYLSMYFAGFMPVSHQTSLFIMIILIFFLLYIANKRKNKNIIKSILFFFLSFITSWFYLFIRYNKAINVWAGIDSVNLLFDFILRKVYINQNDPVFTLSSCFSKLSWYLKNYFENLNVLFLFTLFGFFILYIKLKKFFLISFSVIILNLFLIIYFTYNGNSPEFFYVNKPFYLLNNLFSLFFLAAGFFSFIQYLKNRLKINQYIILIILSFYVLLYIFINYTKNDYSRQFLAYDHGLNILKTVTPDDKIFGKSDIYIFNVQYIKQVKKMYPKITVYDQNGNVLDISIYKSAREKGILNRKMQEKVEIDMYFKNNKDKIYFMDMTSYPEYNLLTRPYGILHKLTDSSSIMNKSENLMKIYCIRDLYNCKNKDYFIRYVLGRYLVRMAEYSAMDFNLNRFEFYKNYALNLAGDVPNIIKNIASIYFHNLKDLKNTMKYLEMAVNIDSYDFAALNLIISLYHEMGMRERELYWIKFYYEKEWRREIKENLLRQINYLKTNI